MNSTLLYRLVAVAASMIAGSSNHRHRTLSQARKGSQSQGSSAANASLIALLVASASLAQGTTDQSYTVPRTSYRHPDLQGIWQTINTAVWNIQDHSAALNVPAGQSVVVGNEIPYQPSALAQREENYRNRATADPEANCKMVGVPRITYMPYPFQIVQTPTQITILYEYAHTVRNIYLDSEHVEPTEPLWMGDSRGRWEGDTLVVDVVGFTDQTWFDRSGNFHSDALHVVERYTRTGPDHIAYEVTIEDPQVFTESWQMSMPLYRRQEKNGRLLEYECYAYLEYSRGE